MRKVTFLIDEAASLGALPILATILQVGRAYAVCLQLYYQSLGQLVAAWPNGGEKVVLGNTTHVYAGTNDYEDAEAISKRCGNYGAVLESGGTSVGSSASRSSSGEGSQRIVRVGQQELGDQLDAALAPRGRAGPAAADGDHVRAQHAADPHSTGALLPVPEHRRSEPREVRGLIGAAFPECRGRRDRGHASCEGDINVAKAKQAQADDRPDADKQPERPKGLVGQLMAGVDAVREGPAGKVGGFLYEVAGDVYDRTADKGAQELTKALFTGDAFVLYGESAKVDQEAQTEVKKEREQSNEMEQ